MVFAQGIYLLMELPLQKVKWFQQITALMVLYSFFDNGYWIMNHCSVQYKYKNVSVDQPERPSKDNLIGLFSDS